MSDPVSRPTSPTAPARNPVLSQPEGSQQPTGNGHDRERNWLPWIVAIVVVASLAALAYFLGSHPSASESSTASKVNPYAAHLVVSRLQISRASNFAGDQLTYVDGTISNNGGQTVTSVRLQVLFANDEGEPPQMKQSPLNLIRTREPYVDTEPVSAAPLSPGATRDFRLIFDDVSPMWNQQIPEVTIQSVQTR